ncbi:hypothetical protein OH492_27050 [Vibrio chagasii]|nr:hypothetical protein [Vibrio chagasii]
MKGIKPAIVNVDAIPNSAFKACKTRQRYNEEALVTKVPFLKYAAQNDIKVVNPYSAANETPLSSLKKEKEPCYIERSSKKGGALQIY